jgi:hypothetical protein
MFASDKELIQKAQVAEREACAVLAKNWPCKCAAVWQASRYIGPYRGYHFPDCETRVGQDIAEVIRARGNPCP